MYLLEPHFCMVKILSMKYRLFFAFLFVTVAAMAQHNHVPNNEGSKVKFQIKNFGITVTGYLSNLKGGITIVAGNVPQAIEVTCDVKTIDTDNERRDNHLREEEYFGADKFPQIRIKSKRIQPTNTPGNYYLFAYLTIKDVTREIQFPFTVALKDGGKLFTGEFTINRLDYHVGGESRVMGDNVKVLLSVMAK